jgi:large subunit ribosomal protein L21
VEATAIYAIVRSGGRQYRVQADQTIEVDRIQADVGSTVDLGVLLLGGNGEAKIGTPLVGGARVVAEVLEHGRGGKIRVFKYKNKTRYRRRLGHRQDFTRIAIREIIGADGETEKKAAPARRRMSKAEEDAPTIAVAAEAPAEAVKEAAPEAVVEVTAEPEAAAGPVSAAKPARRPSKATPPEAKDKPTRKPRTRKAANEVSTEEPKGQKE